MAVGRLLTIGELAARCDVATHVLRHWEDAGLLTPATRISGRRRYDESHVARVVVIRRGKAAGLSLARLREMLDAPDGAGRRAVLVEQHALLDEQIRQARESQQLLAHALACESPDFTECLHFHQLITELVPGGRG